MSAQFGAKGGVHAWEGCESCLSDSSSPHTLKTMIREMVTMTLARNRVISFLRSHIYIKTEFSKSKIHTASVKDFAKLNKSNKDQL